MNRLSFIAMMCAVVAIASCSKNEGNAPKTQVCSSESAACTLEGNAGTCQKQGFELVCVVSPAKTSTKPIAVSMGSSHACALTSDGSVWCWGGNDRGQLGNGTRTDSNRPVKVSSTDGTGVLADVVSLSSNFTSTCALKKDGTVACWGMNEKGSENTASDLDNLRPFTIQNLAGAKAIAAGYQHVCALKDDGTVWCWGKNTTGQLGNGTKTDTSIPTQVLAADGKAALSNVASITSGFEHACALTNTGEVWCWGDNSDGQLGNGNTEASSLPVKVITLPKADSISSWYFHTCATSRGSVWCWGRNTFWQLGDGSREHRPTPVQVQAISGIKLISTGFIQTIAVDETSGLWEWGVDGDGPILHQHGMPELLTAQGGLRFGSGITWISAGNSTACLVESQGILWCWGSNLHGQLGNGMSGSTESSSVPVQVLFNQ